MRVRGSLRAVLLPVVLGATALVVVACSGDDGGAGDRPRPPVPPEPTNLGSGPTVPPDDGRPAGLVAIGIEEVQGIFVEGFEVALRIETGDGELVDAALWTDVVAAQDLASPRSAYDTVWELAVPAGPVVVSAQVEVGTGPPPSQPDPRGALPCRVQFELDQAERVQVEVRFGEGDECLAVVDVADRSDGG